MKIILSPAKNMREADDCPSYETMPVFLEQTEILLEKMRSMNRDELKQMWNCSDSLAEKNADRLEYMNLRSRLTPALFAYTGLAFQHISAGAMTETQLAYLRDHPADYQQFSWNCIVPYRLEMQAVMPEAGDLYTFWNSRIHDEICDNDKVIVNLASKEYSQCLSRYLKEDERMITCVFAKLKNGKPVSGGTKAKMARGDMVWWLSENGTEDPEDMKKFAQGYTYSETLSSETEYVFLEKGEQRDE